MTFLKERTGRALLGVYTIVAAIMVFCMLVIGKLTSEGNVLWSTKYVLFTICISLLLGAVLAVISTFVVYKLSDSLSLNRKVQGKSLEPKLLLKAGILSWLLILAAWLPVFLAYYPGICAYDTAIQFGQLTGTPYNDHHPLFHTKLIGFFYGFGKDIFGDANKGIAVYAVLQSFLLAAVMSYSLMVICKLLFYKNVSPKWTKGILIFVQLFFMFCPFHAFMAVTVTKDTVFTIFVMLQITSLIALISLPKEYENHMLPYVIFICGCIGSNLFRNNGKYAAMIMIAGLLTAMLHSIVTKRDIALFAKLFGGASVSLVISVLMLNYMFSALNAIQGDRREMLSIPIQQMARTMIYHGGVGVMDTDDNTMDEADKQLINEFLLNESYKDYKQDIADPVKRHTNTYVARYKLKDFASTYIGLFLKYPGDYINAFLAVNAGFLDVLDTSHAKVNISETEKGLGYIQTRWVDDEMMEHGIYKDPVLPGVFECLEEWTDSNGYLNIPVINYLLRPGIYLWICIGTAVTLLVFKKYRLLLPMCYVAGYYGTMFFGPTVQLRYVFPVMVLIPLIMCVCGLHLDRNVEK